MKFKFKGTHPTSFENKIIFILKSLGAKNCHFRWLHIFKVIGKSIADHDREYYHFVI